MEDLDAMQPRPANLLAAPDRVLVIAHRGNSRKAPENTLPAFESAAHWASTSSSSTICTTADGVPVVFHDEYPRPHDRRVPALVGQARSRWPPKHSPS